MHSTVADYNYRPHSWLWCPSVLWCCWLGHKNDSTPKKCCYNN